MSSSISLTSAVTSGDENAVSALLDDGADVNERTSGGQTPLILAVIFGHTHLVRLLVKAGADPHQRDNLGLNAIDWAQRRGSREALEIFANGSRSEAAPRKIVINVEEPQPENGAPETTPTTPEVETKESVSEAEKSQRWIAGFKQRLDEQALRRLNRNEPPPIESPHPQELPQSPPPVVAEPEPEHEREPKFVPPPPEPPQPEPPKSEPVRPVHSTRILTLPTPVATGKRKRCPRCNEIYNGDLVSYCAHHIVRLVDADEPIITDQPKSNVPMFWIIVIITFTGSIVLGSLITTYLYKSNQEAARVAAEQQKIIQKGLPELSGELAGKAVSLPEAECPLKGKEPLTGTVTVHIMVDKNGQVYWARGSGGDWLMRGAATDAAMKSTFSPEKLRGRETEGTITYTFKP